MTDIPLQVVFRLDAGVAVGMGHLMRCHALATAFTSKGWAVDFAVNCEGDDDALALTGKCPFVVPSGLDGAAALVSNWPRGIDLLVVDHYGLDAGFEKACRPWAKRIAVIDDMTDRTHACDVLLNSSPGVDVADYAASTLDDCHFLLGPQYALLRPQFSTVDVDVLSQPTVADRLLITMGGSDPENLTLRVFESLSLLPKIPETRIILGPAYVFADQIKNLAKSLSECISIYENVDNMAVHMAWCDIAVSASGSTTWELCAMGVPALYVQTAENQNTLVRAIEVHDVGMVMGTVKDITAQDISMAINALSHDRQRRGVYATQGRSLVDGQGTRRVVTEFIQ